MNTNRSIAVVMLAFAFGCGGSSVKKDEQKKEQVSNTATELGMQQEALEKFQLALDEIQKPKPDNNVAIDALTRSVQLEPKFAEGHYNLGLIYTSLGQNKEAESYLRKAKELDPDVLDYTVALGRVLAVNGQFDEAERLFSEVVAREPANLTAVNNLAVLAFNKGENEVAQKHLQAILREDAENVAALTTLGQVYHKQGNLNLATYIYKRAIKVNEKDPDLHNNLGLVYMQKDDVPNAVNEFSKSIESDPNFLQGRLNLGAILLEYLDYERAGEQFAEAVRIAPKHCTAQLGNAASLYALGKHQDSENGYKFYVDKCDAKHESSYLRLAKLNETFLKRPTEAIKYYEKLLTLTDEKDKITQYNAMINFLKSEAGSTTPKQPEDGAGETPEETPEAQ